MSDLLVVRDVVKGFGRRRARHVAVDKVTMHVDRSEIVGVVGESGSGKSTLARTICGLVDADSGTVHLDGRPVAEHGRPGLWGTVQLVPQDSYGSLNPALSVRDIVAEPAHFHIGRSWDDARAEAEVHLERVSLDASLADRSPSTLSGGQRQRVAIARALAASPSLLVCDESTSALDVSVQAQILVLLQDLQRELGFGLLFVTHDISVVRYLADRCLVMSQGRIVEELPAGSITEHEATQPYTRALLKAVPHLIQEDLP